MSYQNRIFASSKKISDLITAITEVTSDGMRLRDVVCKTQEVCDIAVTNNPLALRYVPKGRQTIAMCTAACEANAAAGKYILLDSVELLPYRM